jgi:hypothetical protein
MFNGISGQAPCCAKERYSKILSLYGQSTCQPLVKDQLDMPIEAQTALSLLVPLSMGPPDEKKAFETKLCLNKSGPFFLLLGNRTSTSESSAAVSSSVSVKSS